MHHVLFSACFVVEVSLLIGLYGRRLSRGLVTLLEEEVSVVEASLEELLFKVAHG